MIARLLARLRAEVHCWWWLLTYGMWRGFCDTRFRDKYGLKRLAACTTKLEVKKIFWEREGTVDPLSPFPGPEFNEWFPRIWDHHWRGEADLQQWEEHQRNPEIPYPPEGVFPTEYGACLRASIALYFDLYDPVLERDYNEDRSVAFGNRRSPAHYEYGGSSWDELHVSDGWFLPRYCIINNSSV